jgi:hypothetical protein
MQTLTGTIEFLTEAILNVQSDLASDWIEEEDKKKMSIQLHLLRRAIVALDTLQMSGKDSQIFSSAIRF